MWEWIKTQTAAAVTFLSTYTTVFCVWLAETIFAFGYFGIIFLMAVESSFIPFPSEVVMPPAGYLIHEGQMTWFWVVASGTFGSLIGAWINYGLGLWLGRPFFLKYGKYFLVSPESLAKGEALFNKHGEILTFVCRLLPVIRQLISLPAGIARMSFFRFTFYTGLGAGIWVFVLTWIGYQVGKNADLLQQYMHSAGIWLLVFVVGIIAFYVKFGRKRHAVKSSAES